MMSFDRELLAEKIAHAMMEKIKRKFALKADTGQDLQFSLPEIYALTKAEIDDFVARH